MDAFARGLKIAATMRKDRALEKFVDQRYANWNSDLGAKIEAGQMNFQQLEQFILTKGEAAANVSGRQELIENVVNRYLDKV